MTTTLLCRFEAVDTWFFRETRPHGSIGSSELGSVFPPPVRTLMGAIRTLVGDEWHRRFGTNWREFATLDALQAIIGFDDDLGSLHLRGPFLSLNGERLYPAPANLLGSSIGWHLLGLGEPVECDLGRVRLPDACGQAIAPGSKPAEQCWLTSDGFQQVLSGRAPRAVDVLHASDLWADEPRLGIGRDNQRRAVQEGMLYQTRHLRLRDGLAVELELGGLADTSWLPAQAMVRLGGEGRVAALTVSQASGSPVPASKLKPLPGGVFVLYSLTAASVCPDNPLGVPGGFVPVLHDGAQVWEGSLSGHPLRLHAVACYRPFREGGWSMVNHVSRPVQGYLPAGSALYVELPGQRADAAIDAFSRLDDAWGRGLFACGALAASA